VATFLDPHTTIPISVGVWAWRYRLHTRQISQIIRLQTGDISIRSTVRKNQKLVERKFGHVRYSVGYETAENICGRALLEYLEQAPGIQLTALRVRGSKVGECL
jgi:hypothetical protein